MTHHPLIPLPFNPLPSTRMSPPFPSVLNHPLITPSLSRYHLLLCPPFPIPPTLRTQSPSHHPIFNPLPSTPMSPLSLLFPPPSARNPRLNPSRIAHPPPKMVLTSQWLSSSPTSTTLRLTSPDSLPPYFVTF